ncbi:MAG: hypothetical protein ACYS76_15520 [Planctomycetota bacterium]
MNGRIIQLTLLLSMLVIVPALGQSGGDYDLSWSVIGGGGGVSSGGDFELSATIGEPEAGASSGGDYELLGGFWPGGPLCFVEFEDFARFADYWLQSGSDLPADLYEDEYNIVDWLDLDVFVEEWLYYCPYDWPLR